MPLGDWLTWHQTSGDPSSQRLYRTPRTFGRGAPYHVGLELKTRERGDGQGGSSGIFQKSVTQAFRARGGLMEYLHEAGHGLRYGGGAVIPAIFTTAQLVATEHDLGRADLETGELPEIAAEVHPWLWYDHNLSQDLKPSISRPPAAEPPQPKSQVLRNALERDMARSVAIVRADGIDDFLRVLGADLEASNPLL